MAGVSGKWGMAVNECGFLWGDEHVLELIVATAALL